MIRGVGLQNFRSFVDKTIIEIKPITVFVGKNSSGKSSLLRTFPLFRQSVEENTTGPILWYGRYVDFGDFTDVLAKNSNEKEITFNFSLVIPPDLIQRFSPYYRLNNLLNDDIPVEVEITVYSRDKKTKTKKIKIILSDAEIQLHFDDNSNVKLIISSGEGNVIRDGLIARNLGQFIPNVALKRKEEPATATASYFFHSRNERPLEVSFVEEATKGIKHFFHSNTNVSLISDSFNRVGFLPKAVAFSVIKFAFREQKMFSKNFETHKDEIMNSLYPCILGWNINRIIDITNSVLSEFYKNIKYIAPLRATSERFYRFQDLQVNEIDHTGSNLAMLLNSLKPFEKNKFEEWTRINFDFTVKVEQNGAHFAIFISTGISSEQFNISDMGFGYSQVLPIVTAIWLETERRTIGPKKPITFIIEQPELHLHPAYQRNLAKIFATVVSKAKLNNIDLKIIFETHSQTMIEALGECIEENTGLLPDDISVLVFEKNGKQQTIVEKSYFDENGYLQNWPVGFFSGV